MCMLWNKRFLFLKSVTYGHDLLTDKVIHRGAPLIKRLRGRYREKVYIDGPCGSKTLAGVLLAHFERVSHVTHFYK